MGRKCEKINSRMVEEDGTVVHMDLRILKNVESCCRQVGAQQFPHAGVIRQAATRPQACFKTSVPSFNLQLVSCARNSRQIIKAGNRQGCQLSSSFSGVSTKRYRCIANRCAM